MNALAKTTKPAKTAAEAYERKKANLVALANALAAELKKDEKSFKADPKNWSYASGLGHVEEKMAELVGFFQGREADEVFEAMGLSR